MQVRWITLLAFVHTTAGSIFPVPGNLSHNIATTEVDRWSPVNGTSKLPVDGRRGRKKPRRSTSSSSGDREIDNEHISGSSLGLTVGSSSSTSDTDDNKKIPKSTEIGRKGWRKWHRKCTPCPKDAAKKWRDPTIKWICGGYQRARRSFKSECMMFYRNCQDGTMFVKISDLRCDHKAPGYNGGRHFFYDYKVRLPDDTSHQSSSSESVSKSETSASYVSKSTETE